MTSFRRPPRFNHLLTIAGVSLGESSHELVQGGPPTRYNLGYNSIYNWQGPMTGKWFGKKIAMLKSPRPGVVGLLNPWMFTAASPTTKILPG